MKLTSYRAIALALAIAGAFMALCAASSSAEAPKVNYPVPAIAPTSWQLTINYHAPQRLIIRSEGQPDQVYWYIRFSLINDTGQDVLLLPDITLITDTGQIVRSQAGVPHSVFLKIKELYNAQFLVDPLMLAGRILQGADNGKDTVAIFSNVSPQARAFKIYIGGLSGETAVQKDPLSGDNVVLHKTLVLSYDIPGEGIGIAITPVFRGSQWIMR